MIAWRPLQHLAPRQAMRPSTADSADEARAAHDPVAAPSRVPFQLYGCSGAEAFAASAGLAPPLFPGQQAPRGGIAAAADTSMNTRSSPQQIHHPARRPLANGENLAPPLGMSRVPSLQFNLEIDDDTRPVKSVLSEADKLTISRKVADLKSELCCSSPLEKQVRGVVRAARSAAARQGAVLSCDDLASTLHRLGFEVSIRHALGGGGGLDCMENLSHRFLVVQAQAGTHAFQPRLLVDIEFKAQFEVAQKTHTYESLLNAMETEFVGSEAKLHVIVRLLCEEMAAAFQELGQATPPWRRSKSMLSKWCPRKSEDLPPTGTSSVLQDDIIDALEASHGAEVALSPVPVPSQAAEIKSTGNRFHNFKTPWIGSARVVPSTHSLPWLQDGHHQGSTTPAA